MNTFQIPLSVTIGGELTVGARSLEEAQKKVQAALDNDENDILTSDHFKLLHREVDVLS